MQKKQLPLTVSHLLGGTPEAAVKELEGQGAVAKVVTQDVPGPLALLFRLRPQPTVHLGSHVNVVVSGDRVIGFNVDARATMADLQARVAKIEQRGGKE
jgi:S1-C subfamily serine protease